MEKMNYNFNEIPALPHRFNFGARQKTIFFENGYGISFVGGGIGLYGDGVKTWEAAEFEHNAWYERDFKSPNDRVNLDVDFHLIYTHTDGDVIGYLTAEECDALIKKIRSLAPRPGMDLHITDEEECQEENEDTKVEQVKINPDKIDYSVFSIEKLRNMKKKAYEAFEKYSSKIDAVIAEKQRDSAFDKGNIYVDHGHHEIFYMRGMQDGKVCYDEINPYVFDRSCGELHTSILMTYKQDSPDFVKSCLVDMTKIDKETYEDILMDSLKKNFFKQ